MNTVYVVTSPELGWDCIVGVFDASKVKFEDLMKKFPEGDYVIFEQDVYTSAHALNN